MSDYLPLFKPGEALTRQASAAITGGQLCAVSGNGTVAPTTGATSAFLGTAAFDAASGADVTLHCGGVQRLVVVGTAVAAGDPVVAAAGGGVTPSATPAVGQQVGVALAAAAVGARAEIKMTR